jgi:polyisoprenoid-binding protein YceI
MKVRQLLSVVSVLALPLVAQAAPETYVLDANHTFPSFSYSHFGYSTQTSRFNKTTGKIVYDKETGQGSVDITIDMTSVDTGSPTFNEHIQGADFFDTAKYPTATFKSTALHIVGNDPVALDGNLTIKGVTLPVTLKITNFKYMMHPILKRDALGANATVVVKRSAFNAGKYAPFVGDDVTIGIAIEAHKE